MSFALPSTSSLVKLPPYFHQASESGMTNEAINEWQERLQSVDDPLVFKT
jgi:hypothetical protein